MHVKDKQVACSSCVEAAHMSVPQPPRTWAAALQAVHNVMYVDDRMMHSSVTKMLVIG